jgi:hypothetical protein
MGTAENRKSAGSFLVTYIRDFTSNKNNYYYYSLS